MSRRCLQRNNAKGHERTSPNPFRTINHVVVVVGICIQPDTVEPAMGVTKEIDLRFVLGYSPLEFRDTLHMIAEGKIACSRE
jgi:threonine dehydrogenase-like Zn-dependent dehydrogenase